MANPQPNTHRMNTRSKTQNNINIPYLVLATPERPRRPPATPLRRNYDRHYDRQWRDYRPLEMLLSSLGSPAVSMDELLPDESGVDAAYETHLETNEGGFVVYHFVGGIHGELERRKARKMKIKREENEGGRGRRGAVKRRRVFRGRGMERDEKGRFIRRRCEAVLDGFITVRVVEVEEELVKKEKGVWQSVVLGRKMGGGRDEEDRLGAWYD